MFMFFLYYHHGGMQVNGVIHGEKSIGMGSDRMTDMVYYTDTGLCLVSQFHNDYERMRFPIIPTL